MKKSTKEHGLKKVKQKPKPGSHTLNFPRSDSKFYRLVPRAFIVFIGVFFNNSKPILLNNLLIHKDKTTCY